jgi:signal transduction histidine kinase
VTTLGESGDATKTKLEELGIISGSIAHELNNPLGGIRILLELLKEDENMSSKSDSKDLDILMSSTNKCIDIVSELLNFTRVKKSESPGDIKTLKDYFEQLKVFTQAYLLSEGVILKIFNAPYLSQKTISADSSLSIKLLEAVAYLSRKINNSSLGSNKTIYLYGTPTKDQQLKITFSSLEPSEETKKSLSQEPQETPLAITPTEGFFEEFTGENQEQTLTLKFSTEVKLNGTHV